MEIRFMERYVGKSWKTTITGYGIAVLVAIQPLVNEDVDFNNRNSVVKFIFRMLVAAGIAAFGKWAADSKQVKDVDAKVNSNTQAIEDHVSETS
jgi:hypothetical protein